MSSVTTRISEIKQPHGGYLPPSSFDVSEIPDGTILNPEENVSPQLAGLVVDYLTRFISNNNDKTAFSISMRGAYLRCDMLKDNSLKDAIALITNIKGLDDTSIISACKMVSFDAWYRNPMFAPASKQYTDVDPDDKTIENLRTMISRSLSFIDQYGPITKYGFTFDQRAFTNLVTSGDGDYLTRDTLWDFKVTKTRIKSKNTLQILMYYLMGKHSGAREFKHIDQIGIFNPRQNKIYTKKISDISPEIIRTVESDVIGYDRSVYDSLKYRLFKRL